MINYDEKEIFEKINFAKKNSIPVFFKNFISDDSIPKWEDFLKCIYESSNEETNSEIVLSKYAQEEESLLGNLLIIDKIYFAPQKSDLNKNFPSIINDIKTLAKIIQPDNLNYSIGFAGPKVSLGKRFVGSHRDPWDAFTIQCIGTTEWIIKNDYGFKESFLMSKGDFLYFPVECYHSINVTGPRAGLIFTI